MYLLFTHLAGVSLALLIYWFLGRIVVIKIAMYRLAYYVVVCHAMISILFTASANLISLRTNYLRLLPCYMIWFTDPNNYSNMNHWSRFSQLSIYTTKATHVMLLWDHKSCSFLHMYTYPLRKCIKLFKRSNMKRQRGVTNYSVEYVGNGKLANIIRSNCIET